MPSLIYNGARELCFGAGLDLLNADVRAILIDDAAYTAAEAHNFLSEVAGGARIATSAALTGKSITGGVFDAADTPLTGVSGATVEAVLVYLHTGVEGTSRLLAYLDGAALTPNGSDVTITWDNGANRIFSLLQVP